jgi:HK97 family phage prohead protease
VQTKSLPVTIEKATGEYDARFVMSATSPDRVKDTIEASAYTPNLGKRLIALYQHDPDRPIGYWDNLRVESGKLLGDLKVASTNLGLMVKQLIADDVPLGASIGFRGRGEANKAGGVHFKDIELMECSVVSIPAHPKAMQIAKSFGVDLSNGHAQNAESGKDHAAIIKIAKAAILRANRTIRK